MGPGSGPGSGAAPVDRYGSSGARPACEQNGPTCAHYLAGNKALTPKLLEMALASEAMKPAWTLLDDVSAAPRKRVYDM